MSTKRGLYVAFEGIDGCGKDTQIDMLKQNISNLTNDFVTWTCEPSQGPVGKLIREEFLSGKHKSDPEVVRQLYMVDRIDNLTKEHGIMEHLREGDIVISNRCFLSSCAYNAVNVFDEGSNGHLLEGSYDPAEPIPGNIKESIFDTLDLNQKIFNLAIPDVIFYIDIPAAEAIKRINKRNEAKEIYDDQLRLSIIRTMYRQAIRVIGAHPFNIFTRVYTLDGTAAPDKIAEVIKEYINYELKSRGNV